MTPKRAQSLSPSPFLASLAVILLATGGLALAIMLLAQTHRSHGLTWQAAQYLARDFQITPPRKLPATAVHLIQLLALLLLGTSACIFFRLSDASRFIADLGRDGRIFLADIAAALWSKNSWLHSLILLLIIVVGILARLAFLNQPMRYDESVTFLSYASRSWGICASLYDYPNNHVLHTLLVRGAYLLMGNSPAILRLPAFLAGVLLIPGAYLLGRVLYSAPVGLFTAALVAGSSPLIEYSTNARGYTLLTLLGVIAAGLGAYLLRQPNRAAWIIFAVAGALGFYAIPIMAYPIASIFVWLAGCQLFRGLHPASWIARRLIPAGCSILVLTLFLYLPVFWVNGWRALAQNSFVAPRTFAAITADLPASLHRVGLQWLRDIPMWLCCWLGLCALLAAIFHRRVARTSLPFAPFIIVTCLPTVILQRVVPFERVWLFAIPACAAFTAAGIACFFQFIFRARLSRLLCLATAAALAVGLCWGVWNHQSILQSDETGVYPDAQPVAAKLIATLQPGDRVIIYWTHQPPLDYYVQRDGFALHYFSENNQTVPAPRIVAVVNEPAENISTLLEFVHADRNKYQTPKPIAVIGSSHIYLLTPKTENNLPRE